MNAPFAPIPHRAVLGLLFLLAAVPPASAQILGTLEAGDHFGYAVAVGDFDADGHDDLAVGVPYEGLSAGANLIADAGVVNVLYGVSGSGLEVARNQLLHQDVAGVEEAAEQYDRFGSALAAGDFDGDGYDDLAVGVPGEMVGRLDNAGAVHVFYGSSGGLSLRDAVWHQDSPSVPGGAETNDSFGEALASGDFDGDGDDDLAVGVPDEEVSTISGAGAVNVLYGSPGAGLTGTGSEVWHQDVSGVDDEAEYLDHFGRALAVGSFDGDAYDDLAIGVPLEGGSAFGGAGAVYVLYGAAGGGLSASGDEFWTQDTPGVLDQSEDTDAFGSALASGDFDADGEDDLAVGVPSEEVDDIFEAGAVNVLYGSSGNGLTADGNELWTQESEGVSGDAEIRDFFGSALAAGNFDGDPFDDLAVGVRGESVYPLNFDAAGAVNVLYGYALDGLNSSGSQFWHQNVPGVLDFTEDTDFFGYVLASGDFDGDGFDDLAIGVPYEDLGSGPLFNAGAVHVLYGVAATGLTEAGDEFWRQGGTGASLTGDGGKEASAMTEGAPAAVTEAPAALALLPAAPNPFVGRTALRFTLPEAGPGRLAVYDVLGREVAVVVDETREAGEHAVAFEAGALPSGAYLVRLEAAGQVRTQRLTRVR